MNRREFLKVGSWLAASAALPKVSFAADDVPDFARGAEVLPPIITDFEYGRNAALKGKFASFFIDDAIWFLRDLARTRPKSLFDVPFLKQLKDSHDRYGLKLQINLFYRTDFFYGMDEFTLKEVPDAYKAEFQANKDWLKLGFHSLQEFPDYPWINADRADIVKLFGMIKGEIIRFAGEGVFARGLVPHWCPMSEEGCRAMKDLGIRIMECSYGPRYQYDGVRTRLPYGHAMRIEQNRKPETAFFWRDSRNEEIKSSVCSYNHISPEQIAKTETSLNYVLDRKTGMRFKHFFCDAPCLNLVDVPTLRADIAKVLGREHLCFSDHEQYFFKDYLAYQPDYAEKIRVMSETMAANGYRFVFLEDLV